MSVGITYTKNNSRVKPKGECWYGRRWIWRRRRWNGEKFTIRVHCNRSDGGGWFSTRQFVRATDPKKWYIIQLVILLIETCNSMCAVANLCAARVKSVVRAVLYIDPRTHTSKPIPQLEEPCKLWKYLFIYLFVCVAEFCKRNRRTNKCLAKFNGGFN